MPYRIYETSALNEDTRNVGSDPLQAVPAANIDLRERQIMGKCSVIVGGGMTAASLALGAIAKGSRKVRSLLYSLNLALLQCSSILFSLLCMPLYQVSTFWSKFLLAITNQENSCCLEDILELFSQWHTFYCRSNTYSWLLFLDPDGHQNSCRPHDWDKWVYSPGIAPCQVQAERAGVCDWSWMEWRKALERIL